MISIVGFMLISCVLLKDCLEVALLSIYPRVQEVILFEDVFFIGLGDFSIHLNEIRQEERIARKRK
ncbi:MAG: hypothetical protein JSV58_02320, partial [Candidatus Bathyarchaeota archaeon]